MTWGIRAMLKYRRKLSAIFKEYQEIRQKISKYKSEVSEKLQSDVRDEDIKLDAVSLEILLDTDKDFLSLNQEISDMTGIEIDYDIADSKDSLNRCQWLEIMTAKDAKGLVEQKRDLAVGLAKGILKKENNTIISKTIGLFYLCYAKLVEEYPKCKWIKYFEDNNLGTGEDPEEFIEKLSALYQKLSEKESGGRSEE